MSPMHVRTPHGAAVEQGKPVGLGGVTFWDEEERKGAGEQRGFMRLFPSRRSRETEGDSQWGVGAVQQSGRWWGAMGGGGGAIVGGRERGRFWYFYPVTSR